MSPRRPDKLRLLAWGLYIVGLLLVLSSPFVGEYVSREFYVAWLTEGSNEDVSSMSATQRERARRRLEQRISLFAAGGRPAWTVASPAIAVPYGLGLAALGICLLRIQRPK